MFDVRASRELQAALFAVQRAPRAIRTDINGEARTRLLPDWQRSLAAHAGSRLEQRVMVKGARVKIDARTVRVSAATSRKALPGGLVPTTDWAGVEYGATPKKKTITTTSRKGRRYTVTRTQGRQFRPRTKRGYVAGPAAAEAGRRLVAGWVRTVVDVLAAHPFTVKPGR